MHIKKVIKNFVVFSLIVSLSSCSIWNKFNKKTADSHVELIEDSPIKIKDIYDSISYAAGIQLAEENILKGVDRLNLELLNLGVTQVYSGDSSIPWTYVEANSIMWKKTSKLLQKQIINQKYNDSIFLAKNKLRPEVITTASGLQYEILNAGKGPHPIDSSQVKVHYSGWLINGKKLESSFDSGKPFVVGVTGVIAGWTEALKLMRQGDKWKIYIPSELAYGNPGRGRKIPPAATLVFEIEVLEVIF